MEMGRCGTGCVKGKDMGKDLGVGWMMKSVGVYVWSWGPCGVQ